MKHKDCHPRPPQPNDLCTCVVTSEVHAVGQTTCGHKAVVVCDHGKWCDCANCITVCEDAWNFYNGFDKDTRFVRGDAEGLT